MAAVRLISPVWVRILAIDKAATEYDHRAREPVLQVARKTVVRIQAQVEFMERERPVEGRAGVTEQTSGYLVVRVVDCERLGYDPARGDKIIELPDYAATYFVSSRTPHAHRRGRAQTWHIEFMDRDPVKAR